MPAGPGPRGAILQTAAADGNGTALDVTPYSTVTVDCWGTAALADRVVGFEGSMDGTNYTTLFGTNLADGVGAASQALTGVTHFLYRFNVTGLRWFRAPISGGTTGTGNVTAMATNY